ncbi:MAG: type II toxin-antitoxin system RelE/ParE family toxin [Tannerella sp.]|jgi:mRNA interferase RelE/StbE|nr:type II toxin-antitoxin system RelE/ParE family toxin [Tannerella sp.]
MYKVVLSKKAEKQLDAIPNPYYKAIKDNLINLAIDPRPYGYRKLVGYTDLYRIQVGSYRIIYSIHDGILKVEVIKIDHRKQVYRNL